MQHFTVKNYEKFQHYQSAEGAPKWIKLYRDLLFDSDFGSLKDSAKAHLMMIWLLSSQTKGRLRFSAEWIAAKIEATDEIDLGLLVDRGYLILEDEPETTLDHTAPDHSRALTLESKSKCQSHLVLSSSLIPESSLDPNCSLETIVTHDPVPAKPKAKKCQIPDDFELNATDRRVAAESKLDAAKVLAEFKAYWKGEGDTKLDWHQTFQSRCHQLTNNPKYLSSARASPNGHHPTLPSFKDYYPERNKDSAQ